MILKQISSDLRSNSSKLYSDFMATISFQQRDWYNQSTSRKDQQASEYLRRQKDATPNKFMQSTSWKIYPTLFYYNNLFSFVKPDSNAFWDSPFSREFKRPKATRSNSILLFSTSGCFQICFKLQETYWREPTLIKHLVFISRVSKYNCFPSSSQDFKASVQDLPSQSRSPIHLQIVRSSGFSSMKCLRLLNPFSVLPSKKQHLAFQKYAPMKFWSRLRQMENQLMAFLKSLMQLQQTPLRQKYLGKFYYAFQTHLLISSIACSQSQKQRWMMVRWQSRLELFGLSLYPNYIYFKAEIRTSAFFISSFSLETLCLRM